MLQQARRMLQPLFAVVVPFLHLQWAPSFVQAVNPSVLPRAVVDPIVLNMHPMRRSPADNRTFGAGIGDLAISSDRQSYFTIIKLGEINFRVALDTGSSDLWITSSACQTPNCKKVPSYPLAYGSPTFIETNGNQSMFSAHYADGSSSSGFIAAETVHVANFSVVNQTFGMVTSSNVTFPDNISGLLGLGFPRLSSISRVSPGSVPFFWNLAAEGLLEYPLFGFSLTRNNSGTLSLGAVDAAVVTNPADITWFPVAEFPPIAPESNISTYFEWAIPLTSFGVNSTTFTPIPTYNTQSSTTPSFALFDIGSSGIYGPIQDVVRIFDAIDGSRLVDPSGTWALPCDTSVPISFTFGSKNFTLQPTDYLIGPISSSPNMCLSWPMASKPSPDGVDWQMGDAFLRTVYTIFNFGIDTKEPPMIGLYPTAKSTSARGNASTSLSLSTQPSASSTLSVASTTDISAFFSSLSATITTDLPNVLLPTPSFSTPPYGLNSSVPAAIGGLVSSGLANSTYSALIGTHTTLANASALPRITAQPLVATLTLTQSDGNVVTTTKTYSMAQVTLGVPPGWSGAMRCSSVPKEVLGLVALGIWIMAL